MIALSCFVLSSFLSCLYRCLCFCLFLFCFGVCSCLGLALCACRRGGSKEALNILVVNPIRLSFYLSAPLSLRLSRQDGTSQAVARVCLSERVSKVLPYLLSCVLCCAVLSCLAMSCDCLVFALSHSPPHISQGNESADVILGFIRTPQDPTNPVEVL